MANVVSKATLFPETLMEGLIQQTKGASAIAQLCGAQPISFTGQKEFTFSLDNEIDIVAENGAKGVGGAAIGTRTIVPLKVEYSARFSDEFMIAAEEYRMDVLSQFSEGFARKLAKGLDLMAIHGINPRTKLTSDIIGTNCFDKAVTNVIAMADGAEYDDTVEKAIEAITAAEIDASGAVFAPSFRSGLARQTNKSGTKLYPELAWGNNPGSINGLPVRATSNLSFNGSKDLALVGDFATSFKWGFAKEMPIEIIQYGNPDSSELGDLKAHNQILIRGEAYLGWAVLRPEGFALVTKSEG